MALASFITYRFYHTKTLLITTRKFSNTVRRRSRRFDPVTFTFTFVLKRRRASEERLAGGWRRRRSILAAFPRSVYGDDDSSALAPIAL